MSGQLTKKVQYSYLFAAFGQGAIYAMMSSWLGRFYTDVLGLSGYFIMALMWVARIWDAVNDPIMGMIVDRTRTKWGKMRPYIAISAPLAMVFTILLFIKPNFSKTGLMVYAAATYIVWGMTYTIGDVPFWALPSAMTNDSKERSRFISISRTFNSVGAALPLVLVAVISTDSMLGQRRGYLLSAIIFAIGGGILYLNSFFQCKECIVPPKEKPTIKENLSLIRQNKPLLIAVAVGVLAFGRYMVQGAISYAADYVFVADGFLKNNIVLICSGLVGI
ncbi:MAG: MFS transporter, partial [Clostridia bacterium]